MSAFQLSPFLCLLLVEKRPLMDSLACGTVPNMLHSPDFRSRTLQIALIVCRAVYLVDEAVPWTAQIMHLTEVCSFESELQFYRWLGSSGPLNPIANPEWAPLRSQWAPVGRSGAQFRNIGSRQWSLLLSLASLLAVKKHESLKNTKIL